MFTLSFSSSIAGDALPSILGRIDNRDCHVAAVSKMAGSFDYENRRVESSTLELDPK